MGVLISIEGGEYTGKTSIVVPRLQEYFIGKGVRVMTSREPGGTPQGEKMRNFIFQRLKEGASPKELALLMNQARKTHLEETIIPFLGKNKEKNGVCILDRYIDSTVVYQGLEGKASLDEIMQLEKQNIQRLYPDLTFIMYFPEDVFAEVLEKRMQISESRKDRTINPWDEGSISEHIQRQKYYLDLPKVYAQYHIDRKYAFIDASREPDEVMKEVINTIEDQGILKSAFESM